MGGGKRGRDECGTVGLTWEIGGGGGMSEEQRGSDGR